MIDQPNIKWLQVEATTKCNAWCHSCGRNQGGFGIKPGLVIEDLDTDKFQETLAQFPNLEVVHFCGTHGDAVAAHNIIDLVEVAKRYCKKIQLNTNGSLRTVDWWKDFYSLLSDINHDVWFCIDGLKGVHEIYRQGTDFDTVVSNASAFIQSGGYATWQFIPWAHNEHQIKDCIRLSQQLGFKKFEFIKHPRVPSTPRHYRTGEIMEIRPWSKNTLFSRFEQTNRHVPIEACQHLTQPSVYLNANGKLSNCCWINHAHTVDRFEQLGDIDQNSNPICLRSCSVAINHEQN